MIVIRERLYAHPVDSLNKIVAYNSVIKSHSQSQYSQIV